MISPSPKANDWPGETIAYFRYALALFRPGRPVPVFNAHNVSPDDLDDWTVEDKILLVDEGRRQMDQQTDQLNQISTKAQIVFTTGLAVGAGISATSSRILGAVGVAGTIGFLLWIISAMLVVLALLGASSIVVTRSEFSVIHTTLLTKAKSPILDSLAPAYARAVRIGGNTIATRLSLLRNAVLLLLISTILLGIAWTTAALG